MCDSCGDHLIPEADPGGSATRIRRRTQRWREAARNRDLLDDFGVLAVNLLSAPGGGKTALLEVTIPALRECRIGVIEADRAAGDDAARIRAHGIPAVPVVTGDVSRLDARMVHAALHGLDLRALDLLFIENVGNLASPADLDLGQHRNVVLLSMTGADEALTKYRMLFRAADLVLVTRADLAPTLDAFSLARATAALRRIGCRAPMLTVSAWQGQGFERWLAWLRAERAARHAAAASG